MLLFLFRKFLSSLLVCISFFVQSVLPADDAAGSAYENYRYGSQCFVLGVRGQNPGEDPSSTLFYYGEGESVNESEDFFARMRKEESTLYADIGHTELRPPRDAEIKEEIVSPRKSSASRHFCDEMLDLGKKIRTDYWNYYSWNTAWRLALATGIAAPFANTSLDMDFHYWYQRDVRSTGMNNFSNFCKPFGEGAYLIPGFACLALVACVIPEDWGFEDHPIGNWGKNAVRSYLVGAPALLAMQFILGGSRPEEEPHGPAWHPFSDSNSVSGHAFMGAVPFIVAAKSTDSFLLKTTFYLLSTFTAWSRINDGAHSLSQVCLGWYMAYLACDVVSATNTNRDVRTVTLLPFMSGNTVGMGAYWRF